MKKVITNTFIIIYFIIAILVTICLLAYNEFKVTQLGDYTLISVTDEELEGIANKGDLIIAKQTSAKHIEVDDNIMFFMRTKEETFITAAKVTDKQQNGIRNYTYLVEGEYRLSDRYIIGKADECTKIPYLGTVLNILESKYIFLFLVVFPSFILFLYEGYKVIMEIKYGEIENS